MTNDLLSTIKIWIELAGAIILAITCLIILLKIIFKKLDKNKNGKIEAEEINDGDIDFCKDLLKESVKIIASGIAKNSGMTGKQAYNFTLSEIKKAKNVFEETIEKGEQKK